MPRSGQISITVSVTHGKGINHKHSPEGVELFKHIDENNPHLLKFNRSGAVSKADLLLWISLKVIKSKCFQHLR